MTTYRYTGITRGGKDVTGVIRAPDEFEAVAVLRQQFSVVTSLEEVREEESRREHGLRVNGKQLALLCSQFAIILDSGLPIVRCVEMVAAQTRDRRLRTLLSRVAEDVAGGYPLAGSFENNIPSLPPTFIETVRAGEQSGTLSHSFRRLHRYFEKNSSTRQKIVSALTYPAIVTAVAVVVSLVIITVAVPAFTSAYAALGGQLPLITRALIAVSDFLRSWWYLLVILLGLLGCGFLIFRSTRTGQEKLSEFSLSMSPLAGLHNMSLSAQFADTLSTMLSAGLPLIRGLEITADVMPNLIFAEAVRRVRKGVEQGKRMTDCMAAEPSFAGLLTEMTGVGESTDSLEEVLDVIGAYFDNEVDARTRRMLTLLEPVITCALAVMTITLLLAVYLPMFTLYGSIG